MMRSAALTVRLPGVSTAPAISTSTWSQTGAMKKPRKASISEPRIEGTIAATAAEGNGSEKR
jgi:hypothetical protein